MTVRQGSFRFAKLTRWIELPCAILGATLLAQGALASDYQIGFGPFVGGGRASDGSAVRHTSGYSLALERGFHPAPQVLPRLTLAPRFELTNSFVNTRSGGTELAHDQFISTYDNRIFAAGFSIGQDIGNDKTFAQGAYLTAMAGKGYTKLSIDETSDTRYRQLLWGGLSGNYFGAELGAWIPFKGVASSSFGINLALVGSIYEAKLPTSSPTQDGREDINGESIALTGSADRSDLNFGERVFLKTFAVKIGVTVGL